MEAIVDKSKCECCNVNFLQNRDYDKHVKTKKHLNKINNVPMEKCPHCPYETLKQITMFRHIKKEHKKENQEKTYCRNYPDTPWRECIYCYEFCNSLNGYERHILSNKHIKSKFLQYIYHCEFCEPNFHDKIKNPDFNLNEFNFLNHQQYIYHMMNTHPIDYDKQLKEESKNIDKEFNEEMDKLISKSISI